MTGILFPVPLLEVANLTVDIPTQRGTVHAVRGISMALDKGRSLGIVGESGCGKTMTGLALMALTPSGARIGGSIRFEGRELVGCSEREYRKLRGGEIGIVFQDPFTSLNPVMTVGAQVAEAVALHTDLRGRGAWNEAVEMLATVRLPVPHEAATRYPHMLSGGQRQRVVIAMALACKPKLLVADEPTTALDVTLQAQTLALLRELQRELDLACILISHDLGVVGSFCDDVMVMYAGMMMEEGAPKDVISRPRHPYTVGLLGSLPRKNPHPNPPPQAGEGVNNDANDATGLLTESQVGEGVLPDVLGSSSADTPPTADTEDPNTNLLTPIPGQPPSLITPPPACPFEPRCPRRLDRCSQEMPSIAHTDGSRSIACWNPVEDAIHA